VIPFSSAPVTLNRRILRSFELGEHVGPGAVLQIEIEIYEVRCLFFEIFKSLSEFTVEISLTYIEAILKGLLDFLDLITGCHCVEVRWHPKHLVNLGTARRDELPSKIILTNLITI